MTGLLQRSDNEEGLAEHHRKKASSIQNKNPNKKSASESLAGETSESAKNDERAGVVHTLESEIIPRLILSHRDDKAPNFQQGPVPTDFSASIEQINGFAKMLTSADADQASSFLDNLRGEGASLESLYLGLMGPAARRLGYLWEEDQGSIIDVTLGVGRLQQLLRELSPEFQHYTGLPDMRRRALLLPVPGEQHTFGLSLLMDFFRREGWDLWGWPLLEDDDLLSLTRNEWFGVIGLSVSAEVNLDGLAALIRDLRKASANKQLGILVGGPVLIDNPQICKEIGADATATDAPQAIKHAESLLSLQ